MITIVSALKGELQPFLERWKVVKKKSIAKGTLYISDKPLHFLRCGMGGGYCNAVLDSYLQEYHPKMIINVGMAGIVNPIHKPETIFKIANITQLKGESIRIFASEGSFDMASLLTLDKPLINKEIRDQYFYKYGADLVDMEGWYCAEKAAAHQIKFLCYKISSDYANEDTEKDFIQNYNKLAKKLVVAVNPVIKGFIENE